MAKRVLITGGGRGIGRATALHCARAGWSVGFTYRSNAESAAETLAALKTEGVEALAVQGDVTEEAELVAGFDAVEDALGPLDAVVNNAGILAPAMGLAEMEAERIERIVRTNVYGALLCAREAARRLSFSAGGKGGVLVNVSSAAARLGSANEFIDYAASKGAVDTMTIGLARELGPDGVRVNAVRPGLIETDIHASAGRANRAAALGNHTPLGRAGQAEEVASAICWLLSDDASYVTGALLDVAGGR